MTQTQRRQASLARGRWAEDQALDFLQSEGLRLIARNVRYRCGELDLIMTDGLQVVFVEVRYRARTDYGSAAASVDHRKRQRLLRAALLWLSR
ncbi:MAG: YraN family protein, partial [Burkholderiaceae bacterium]